MDEKTVRLLDRVTEKLATKIAEKIVDTLSLRLADKIAERIVQRQRWVAMTDEEMADQCLRPAGWTPNPGGGWAPPPKREREHPESRRSRRGADD